MATTTATTTPKDLSPNIIILLKQLYGLVCVSYVIIGMLIPCTSISFWSPFCLGIQLFMCVYGLAVFLESPREVRKGRAPYIFISFLIFFLYTITELNDGYQTFQLLYKARVVTDITELRQQLDHSWWAITCLTSGMAVNWIGDALLVRLPLHSLVKSSRGRDISYIAAGLSWPIIDGYAFPWALYISRLLVSASNDFSIRHSLTFLFSQQCQSSRWSATQPTTPLSPDSTRKPSQPGSFSASPSTVSWHRSFSTVSTEHEDVYNHSFPPDIWIYISG